MNRRSISTIQKAIIFWYRRYRRSLPWRESRDPYRVWVSEVMLQQTRIETVIPYYHRFMKRFPDIVRLAEADMETLLKRWEGLGYYSRARNMQLAAKMIVKKHGGTFPDSADGLLTLPGIGDYIAAAVGSICFDLPVAVVDGNVKRVLSRLFVVKHPVNDAKSKPVYAELATTILDRIRAGEFNQAVMELGQRICTPRNPCCADCPIRKQCSASRKGHVADYPVRLSRARPPLKKMLLAVVIHGRKWLVVKRPEKGLLGGLWELPGGEMRGSRGSRRSVADMVAAQYNLRVTDIRKQGTVRHAYTHFRVSADVYTCRYESGSVTTPDSAGHRWIRPEEIDRFPFHTLIHKAVAAVGAMITPPAGTHKETDTIK